MTETETTRSDKFQSNSGMLKQIGEYRRRLNELKNEVETLSLNFKETRFRVVVKEAVPYLQIEDCVLRSIVRVRIEHLSALHQFIGELL
jgi:hypothetical protein